MRRTVPTGRRRAEEADTSLPIRAARHDNAATSRRRCTPEASRRHSRSSVDSTAQLNLKIGEMWKRGKKRDEEEALSEGDEPPKKSSKPSAAAVDNDSDESDNIVVCELSKNRKVSVRNWNGKVVVDIREFYYKDGKEMPGKKGISLTMDQWKVLRDHVDEINQEVAEN
ncbi:unnamed protein product [Fraxinus pennsylvanica]|uniref:Transcriptional coactivator p15 (PC4) C-terminal domain-containing protein n=1 Tax=Fraxinus pennsylvanica TaxID=56036 RepID=A0AAD2DLG8_9LAMI|nr:unnamed protein product [Fraxinus pennsylvanica]